MKRKSGDVLCLCGTPFPLKGNAHRFWNGRAEFRLREMTLIGAKGNVVCREVVAVPIAAKVVIP